MNRCIYCIIGESGSGKSTVCETLESRYGLKQIQSYTTRPMRKENEKGHIFVTQEEFDKIRDDLTAYTQFNNFEYGTTNEQINTHDLYVIDPYGVKFLKEKYTGNKKVISIYIKASAMDRISRMFKRGDGESQVVGRLINDEKEFKDVEKICDYIVENKDFEKCVEEVYEIIVKENKDE